jgi:hypothetical protein
MTVCIAAMCWDQPRKGHMVVVAADRMMTAGAIEYEPAQSKIWSLTSSIAAVGAGDADLLTELMTPIINAVQKRAEEDPGTWWELEEVAKLYQDHYARVSAQHAERQILAPLGLSMETFVSRQKEMADSLLRQVAAQLLAFRLSDDGIDVIFAGTDHKGTHIFASRDGEMAWCDGIGFAAIGAGSPHADSQLMFQGHSKWKGVPETLLLVYSAKKRAEVAPGVGKATDMFIIGPALGSFLQIPDAALNKLDSFYSGMSQATDRGIKKARQQVRRYLEQIEEDAKSQEPKAQAVENPIGNKDEGASGT